ncbi:glutathione S-transferase [Terasakiella sp. A23]|uniref:glutathione S-transferase family protein n=1 Tax=Terasakiella sp. FCG-A23 TaxID=3080561 RepID=UPI002953105C|nr:glutathione S-transferase [Terasakiella sp. A23]MDV7341407.1 glutathione S-transferase [Terasakiella sp. A23]
MTNALFPQNADPVKVYWFPLSGHAHRAQLMLSLLDIPHKLIPVDLANGEHKTPDYLNKLHPFGLVPVIDDNGVIIWESNAILTYLATKYDSDRTWLPTEPVKAAHVQQWLALASGMIINGPGAARLVKVFGTDHDHDKCLQVSKDLFDVLEGLLKDRTFTTGEAPTIADVSAYSYVAHAPEGHVDLAPYPTIQKWIKAVEALPNFVAMKKTET